MQILIMVYDMYHPVRFQAQLRTLYQHFQADYIIYLNA